MKSIAILEYGFIFPLDDLSGYDFEKSLVDVFASKGFAAQLIETKGGTSRRLFYITKKPDPMPLPNPKPKSTIKSTEQAMRDFKRNIPKEAR